jgi:hypothetical protein
MDPAPNTSRKLALKWIWWGLVLPLVVTVVGGLVVEHLKPEKDPAKPATEGGRGPKADGEHTYQYWCEINRAQERPSRSYALQTRGTREEVVPLLTAMAAALEALPSRGVDADAIEVGCALADSMRRLASFLQRNTAAAGEVPDTVRTLLFGEPGVFKDHTAKSSELRRLLQEAAARARKMRALLSARYDRDFPALDAVPPQPKQPADAERSIFRICKELTALPPEVELARLRHEAAALDKEIAALVLKAGAKAGGQRNRRQGTQPGGAGLAREARKGERPRPQDEAQRSPRRPGQTAGGQA